MTLLLVLPGAAGDRPAYSLEDPDCEADPEQLGCDPACAGPEECDHPPCPTDLAGYAPQTGGVFMSWTVNSYSDIKVLRDDGNGSFEEVAYLQFPATRWLDHDTEPGETYRYRVVAVGMHQYNDTVEPEGESPSCGTLEVTTVPVFPTALAGVAAVGIGVGGYVAFGRRRNV